MYTFPFLHCPSRAGQQSLRYRLSRDPDALTVRLRCAPRRVSRVPWSLAVKPLRRILAVFARVARTTPRRLSMSLSGADFGDLAENEQGFAPCAADRRPCEARGVPRLVQHSHHPATPISLSQHVNVSSSRYMVIGSGASTLRHCISCRSTRPHSMSTLSFGSCVPSKMGSAVAGPLYPHYSMVGAFLFIPHVSDSP